jgi:hypothetical protein
MIASILCAAAVAADVHVEIAVGEGPTEKWSVPYTETVSKKLGPIQDGKTTASYIVTMQPSVWDPLTGSFKVDLAVCREWRKKGKDPGRYCQKEQLVARTEAEGPTESTTNLAIAGEKFSYVLRTWYVGDPPGPVGLPVESSATDGSEGGAL